MNKASMILEICAMLDVEYTPSMHKMGLDELITIHGSLYKVGKGLKEFRENNWDKTLPLNEAYKKYIKKFEDKHNSLTTELKKKG